MTRVLYKKIGERNGGFASTEFLTILHGVLRTRKRNSSFALHKLDWSMEN